MAEPPSHRPLLSVVMPVYGVEDYVREAMESVLASTLTDLELVVVDDDSPDRSREVALHVAATDARVRVVQQPHGGLGAARNLGVHEARGTYLAFADSDDWVPRDAYAQMVSSLEATGSDLVVGSMAKVTGGVPRVPHWLARMHDRRLPAVRLDDVPELVLNVFAWNKVYRRSSWDAVPGGYPESVAYEDHLRSVEVYLGATAIDVLPDVVYLWRIREDQTSITQRKHELDNLRDAVLSQTRVRELLDHRASPEVRRAWRLGAALDFRPYFDALPSADRHYRRVLVHGVRAHLVAMDDDELLQLPVRLRVLLWLATRRRSRPLLSFIEALHADDAMQIVTDDDGDRWDGPAVPASVPRRLLRPTAADRRLRMHVESASLGSGSLQLNVVTTLFAVRPDVSWEAHECHLVPRHGGEDLVLPARLVEQRKSAPGRSRARRTYELDVPFDIPESDALPTPGVDLSWVVMTGVSVAGDDLLGGVVGWSDQARDLLTGAHHGPGFALVPGQGLLITPAASASAGPSQAGDPA